MSVVSVATAALKAILASSTVISLGAVSQWWSLLSDSSTSDLSKLTSTLLEPLLAFSSLCTLTSADLLASIPFLLWPLLHVALGLGLALLLLPRSPNRGALLVLSAFGNAGALPMALIPVLLSGPAVDQAVLFVQVYLATWRLLLWSIAPALIARRTRVEKRGSDGGDREETLWCWLRRMLLPPPSIGSLLGISLAFAPPSFRSLILSGHLSFAYAAAKSAGAASPPLVLINLGYSLARVGGRAALAPAAPQTLPAPNAASRVGKLAMPPADEAGVASSSPSRRRQSPARRRASSSATRAAPATATSTSGSGGATPPCKAAETTAILPSPRERATSPPEATRTISPQEIVIVCVVKLLALPILHLLLCAHALPLAPTTASSDVLSSQTIDRDPFHLVLLLQAAMPAAVSVQAIFQREGVDTRPLGIPMTMQYALAMPSIVGTLVAASRL